MTSSTQVRTSNMTDSIEYTGAGFSTPQPCHDGRTHYTYLFPKMVEHCSLFAIAQVKSGCAGFLRSLPAGKVVPGLRNAHRVSSLHVAARLSWCTGAVAFVREGWFAGAFSAFP